MVSKQVEHANEMYDLREKLEALQKGKPLPQTPQPKAQSSGDSKFFEQKLDAAE